VRDVGAAEDVLQQVMLDVWQRGDRFDPARGSIRSWLLTITRSRALDHLRRRVPEPHDPSATDAIVDRAAIEHDRIGELLEQWRVTQLLGQIPGEEARLLRMRFQLEMSQSEIAAETGIPLGTVKSRTVRGLSHLRALINAERQTAAGGVG
jgi:RNA polymerase sigma-70 factor (ECF subfamily)